MFRFADKGCSSDGDKGKRRAVRTNYSAKANVMEAAVVNRLKVYGVENILEVIGFFNEAIDLHRLLSIPEEVN